VLTIRGFSFDVELLSVALFFKFRIATLPVMFERISALSESTVSVLKNSYQVFFDLIAINFNWHRKRYFSKELKDRIASSVYVVRDSNLP
jgi:hypothetical protein